MPFYAPNEMDKKENEKQLAEFQWRFNSEQKEAFALARKWGTLAVAEDIDPGCVVGAAIWLIFTFTSHAPRGERREAFISAVETLVELGRDKNIFDDGDDDPV